MRKKRGFVAVSTLITMFLILTIATMGISSSAGLRKTYVNNVKVKENYLVGENFITYYQLYTAERVKDIYKNMPYNPKYEDVKDNLDEMNLSLLNYCYKALSSNWYTDFNYAIKKEDTQMYLDYNVFKVMVERRYYNTKTKKYEDFNGKVINSDFRADIMMQLDDNDGKRLQLDTNVYFNIPSYTVEQMEQWLADEEITINEEDFEINKLTQVGDVVVFG